MLQAHAYREQQIKFVLSKQREKDFEGTLDNKYRDMQAALTVKFDYKVKFDYEFVWWNAWLYSGSDTLWAGLIKALYDTTERHFGSDFANARAKATFYKVLIEGLVALLLLGVSIFLVMDNQLVTSEYDGYTSMSFGRILAPLATVRGGVRLHRGPRCDDPAGRGWQGLDRDREGGGFAWLQGKARLHKHHQG